LNYFKIFIIIILICFFTFCDTHKKTNKSKYDISYSVINDTLNKSNLKLIEHYLSLEKNLKPKNKDVTLVSSIEYYPVDKLKIIEINKGKVIKQTNGYYDGRIVYKIPDVMKIRSTYKVLVRIAKSKATVSLYDSLSGNVITSRIPVTETMEVKLIDVSPKDNKNFDIVELNNAVQLVENGDTYTEWSWGVTPIKLGNSNLKIVVSVIKNDNKKDIVYEDTVMVEKDILVQIIFFFKKYWQVLLTSIVIPLVVWIYKKRSKKKNNNEDDKNNEED